MAVPKEILQVERPKNTVVKKSGNHFYVVSRTSKYVNGRRLPVDLETIGKIIDGKFVPKTYPISFKQIDIKDYGQVALISKFSKDILDNLLKHFHDIDAFKIYTIALLRSIYHDCNNNNLSFYYDTSYVSVAHPNIHLGEKTISKFLDLMGRNYGKINSYLRAKLDELSSDSEIIIDGTLKTNNSKVNAFSEFSRKGKIKHSKDISLIYAFNSITKEPVISKVYSGNTIDSSAFKDFIKDFSLNKGLIMGDKGFLTNENYELLCQNSNLKFLFPIKRNLKEIKILDLLNYEGILDFKEEKVLYKKTKINENLYYYAFKNTILEQEEKENYLAQKQKKDEFSNEDIKEKQEQFGTIIYKSNCDMAPLDIYLLYRKRWEIEVMFNFYKTNLCFNKVNVSSTYSVIATEFINLLSTIISMRVKNYLIKKELLKKFSYKQIMKFLDRVKAVKSSFSDKWEMHCSLKNILSLCDILDINL